MAHYPAIRVVLAMLVAFWSPAWCCCRLLEAGHCTPTGSPDRHHGPHEPVASHHDQLPCSELGEDDCSPCGGDRHPGDGCGCQNHELQVDLTRAVEIPSLKLTGVLDWSFTASQPTVADLYALARNTRLRSEAATTGGAVRAQTLYARRCLLLI